jgi:hypothetical protein
MVKGKHRKMVVKVIGSILFLVITSLHTLPIRFSVKMESLAGKEYIICKEVRTTGFDWIVVESSFGYAGYVELRGKIPLSEYRNNYPRIRFNSFVCYGEFLGEGEFDGYDYRIFKVSDWDVLYPVQRESALPQFLLPKSWLVPLDAID